MKSVEEKYGSQVRVVFYDVWTEAGRLMVRNMASAPFPPRCFLIRKGMSISVMKDFSRRRN